MDIRIPNIFLHLASALHFGRTSSAFTMTPSTLTRIIQRLVEKVGPPFSTATTGRFSSPRPGCSFKSMPKKKEDGGNRFRAA